MLGACRASAAVAVDVAADGSGTVTASLHLDAEAVARVGDPAKALEVEDLRSAGWSVPPPQTVKGETTFVATKRFGSPAGLQEVMSELGRGLFDGWKISIDDGFGSTTTKVSGRIHLSGSLDQFGDEALTAALDGQPLGRSAEQLAQEGGGKPPTFPLTVTLRLPGDVESRTHSWTFEVGDDKKVQRDLGATSEHGSLLPVVLGVGGAVALLAAALLALTPARHARSRRRGRSASAGG